MSEKNFCQKVFLNFLMVLTGKRLFWRSEILLKRLQHRSFSVDFEKHLKEMRSLFKKWPLNLWWISNKTIIEVGNITKAATFKSFLHLSYKNTQLLFFVTVLFNIFMRQTLTNDTWPMNCMFPLRTNFVKNGYEQHFLLKLYNFSNKHDWKQLTSKDN